MSFPSATPEGGGYGSNDGLLYLPVTQRIFPYLEFCRHHHILIKEYILVAFQMRT